MNVKLENQLRLGSLITHRNKILTTIYPDDYTAAKENVLKILDGVIEDRAGLCAVDYEPDRIRMARS